MGIWRNWKMNLDLVKRILENSYETGSGTSIYYRSPGFFHRGASIILNSKVDEQGNGDFTINYMHTSSFFTWLLKKTEPITYEATFDASNLEVLANPEDAEQIKKYLKF